MRARLRLLPIVAALLLSACASHQNHFVCPTKGGPEWREVTTEHFVLQTDVGSRDATRLARDLETMRAAVLLALFRSPPAIPGRVRVVALAVPSDFGVFVPPGARGAFTVVLDEPVIVVPGHLGTRERFVLSHELAHYVTRWTYPRQPRWFAEGIASLAEPLAETDRHTRPSVGGLGAYRVFGARARPLPVRDLLAWDGMGVGSTHHDWSAILVHYLLTAHPQRFTELQRRFSRAQDPAVAWREVFPEWDPSRPGATESLDAALREHLLVGVFDGKRAIEPVVTTRSTQRMLSAGEIHDVRLSLPRYAQDEAALPRGLATLSDEIDEALAEDPGHVAALQRRAALSKEPALAPARLATERHPRDVRAWLWLAAALGPEDADARLHALERALEVAPHHPFALNNLAWELLSRDRAEEALPMAREATQVAPWSAAAIDTWAAALEKTGRCAEALGAAERAVELVPEQAPAETWAPVRERAARLRSTCPAAQPASVH